MSEVRQSTSIKPLKAPLISRRFTLNRGVTAEVIKWRTAVVELKDDKGKQVMASREVRVPHDFSDRAALIAASKYLTDSESGVDELFGRVVNEIFKFGLELGYFLNDEEAQAFAEELGYILETQRASFNSPVYFNVGITENPQCSACFILEVSDDMESILRWYRNEGMIFAGGSGAGVNLSPLRSHRERLLGRGYASGPLSFMKAADASAGVIKSGGRTRRAAKMVVLNADHPDIFEFVDCKVHEEEKMRALIAAGYSDGIDGEARETVAYQNANNSVRVTDEFMRAVEADADWQTRFVVTGEICETFKARDLFRKIVEAAHACGDPGLQFDSTIQRWHTNPKAGRINASNPCSEYMHLDNTPCNLASLRLTKFLGLDGSFLIDDYIHTIQVTTTAMDIIVSMSGYPTDTIAKNARKYRELGLGHADLGAAIMQQALPYDSDAGRAFGAAVTSLLTAATYRQSTRIGKRLGAAEGLETDAIEDVFKQHYAAAMAAIPRTIDSDNGAVTVEIARAGLRVWQDALRDHKYTRNTQATVIAPTGTIALLMDCDTTGAEPAIALISEKSLVGGGTLKMTNESVRPALARLGYAPNQIQMIIEEIKKTGTIEGACRPEDLPIFDCAFKPQNGVRSIAPEGHIKMIAALQPFISGGISKTVNLPNDASASAIETFYINAWRLGLKSISVYRDGCKAIQPLKAAGEITRTAPTSEPRPLRHRLEQTCDARRHHFNIGGHKGYFIVGKYADGTPGEIFVTMSKHGSTVAGFADAFATALSFALQFGVPLEFIVRKFKHMTFEPSGFTGDKNIPEARSIPDYLAKWLELEFLRDSSSSNQIAATVAAIAPSLSSGLIAEGPPCDTCGRIMIMQGTCYQCFVCGDKSGC